MPFLTNFFRTLKKYYFSIILIFLFLLAATASFYRFVVIEDYIVLYEAECDPQISSCYADCEDEECTKTYYYAYITRQASTLRNLCGPDITDCDAANSCLEGEDECSVEYCSGADCTSGQTEQNVTN